LIIKKKKKTEKKEKKLKHKKCKIWFKEYSRKKGLATQQHSFLVLFLLLL